MARLRQISISLAVAVIVSGCGRVPSEASAATPVAERPALPATPAAPAKPGPDQIVRVAPEWQSRVPEITVAQAGDTLRQAREALARGQLERGTSPGPGALELYLAVLAVVPGDSEAQAGVQSVLDALFERGRLAMRGGRLQDAERVDVIAASLMPGHADLPVYRSNLAAARQAAAWVEKADAAGKAGHVATGEATSALAYLNRAERAFPDFEPVARARAQWNARLLDAAWQLARAEDFRAADSKLLESARLAPGSTGARVVGLRIIELRQALTAEALAKGNSAVDALQLDRADEALAHAQKIAAQTSGVDELRYRIYLARHYGPFKPGQVFTEMSGKGITAPEMVVVPFGRFTMGAPEGDKQRRDNELPQHEVVFERGFAIARNETTVAEFKRFVDATGYRSVATRAGQSIVYDEKGGVFGVHAGVDWRRDHMGRIASPALPVVHIALQDALAYAGWLSARTGQRYRLPSEAEFEYVLRAGSKDIYPWGNSPPRKLVGNLPGDGDLSRSGRSWGNAIPGYRDAFWGPAPVRNFPVERFGTFDMIGNVSEWTLDCWHDSYQRAPMDGSAWVNPGCPQRVVRGASWGSSLDQARSASRLPMQAETTTARLGFRVVREI